MVEELGADAFVYGTSDVEGTPNNVIIRVNGRDASTRARWSTSPPTPSNVHVFDTESGARLSE